MTRVRAPGSSANVGSGFDVLGVAISRHAWVSDEGSGEPIGPDHLVSIAHRAAGGRGPLWFGFDLVPGRGLGFSAAARAAAAVLACVQQGCGIDEARRRAYLVVADLEGHGDNAAASVWGGIQLVADDMPHRLPSVLPGQLLLWVPSAIETSTEGSRQELPDLVGRTDAVFNLGRVALLVAALYEGDLDLLRRGTEDRLHQPNRLDRCVPSQKALRAALDAGASAAWLSGSGPSVAVVTPHARRDEVAAALPADGNVLDLDIDHEGAVVADSAPETGR